jgi:hypothetical protein
LGDDLDGVTTMEVRMGLRAEPIFEPVLELMLGSMKRR